MSKYLVDNVKYHDKEDSISKVLNNLSFVINAFGKQEFKTNFQRVVADIEMLYVLKGETIVNIDGEIVVGYEGDIIVIPSFTKNSISTSKENPHTYYWVHFDVEPFYLNDYFIKLIALDKKIIHAKNLPWVKEYFDKIFFEQENSIPGYKILRHNAFVDMLTLLCRYNHLLGELDFRESIITSKESKIIQGASKYIQDNLSKRFKVCDIAEELFISESYLFKVFSKTMNMSPTLYIQTIKAKKAKILLETSDCPLTEIAEQLGFTTYYYFSTFFKKIYGISPRKFRNMFNI